MTKQNQTKQQAELNSQAMALRRGTYDGEVGGESGLGRSCITVILWRKSANNQNQHHILTSSTNSHLSFRLNDHCQPVYLELFKLHPVH